MEINKKKQTYCIGYTTKMIDTDKNIIFNKKKPLIY